MTTPLREPKKKISMFKHGFWIPWDGSDVQQLMIEERVTLKQLKEHFPDLYTDAVNAMSQEKIK